MEKTSVLVALFAALIAALGLVPAFPLASGVPITAQSLGVMLCGTILGSKKGGLAALLFIFLTLVGLPLLAGGRGGVGQWLGTQLPGELSVRHVRVVCACGPYFGVVWDVP